MSYIDDFEDIIKDYFSNEFTSDQFEFRCSKPPSGEEQITFDFLCGTVRFGPKQNKMKGVDVVFYMSMELGTFDSFDKEKAKKILESYDWEKLINDLFSKGESVQRLILISDYELIKKTSSC